MKTAAMTTMMAGPRTAGLGCFSFVQWLETSRARLVLYNIEGEDESYQTNFIEPTDVFTA